MLKYSKECLFVCVNSRSDNSVVLSSSRLQQKTAVKNSCLIFFSSAVGYKERWKTKRVSLKRPYIWCYELLTPLRLLELDYTRAE